LSDAEIANMYMKMQDVLQHNFNMLVDQTYLRTVTAIT